MQCLAHREVKQKRRVSSLAQGLLAGPQGHVDNHGQCRCYYEVLSGSNEVTVTVTSSIQNVEELKSVSLANRGLAGCL
jgi:hypothetical protein